MNKQSRQHAGNLSTKLELCSDELSALLDLIYKFPQQQRERYYDRIQLLKQNITQLKVCARQSSLTAGLQKKYQQLFIKLNELKAEISSCEISIPAKKKRGQASEVPPLFSENYQTKNKQGRTGKTDYDEIMETLVHKEDELKKYKYEVEQYKKVLKQYEDREMQSKRFYENLQKELYQIKSASQTHSAKAQSLEVKLKEATARSQILESTCNQYKINAQTVEQEMNKLVSSLNQVTADCKLKKIEIESYVIQLAALEEKYRYDLKSHIERQDLWKIKEKSYEKKLSDLQKSMELLIDADSKKQELLHQNARLKEDVKVLETELTLKQEYVYQKNKKLQTYKTEIEDLKALSSERQDKIERSQGQLELTLRTNKQSENIISLQQKKIAELQGLVAQKEEAKMISEKKLRKLEQQANESRLELQKLKQELRKSQSSQHRKDEDLVRLRQEKQLLEKEEQRNKLELARIGRKAEQLTNILGRMELQKMELQGNCELAEKEMRAQEERCKKHDKEIDSLKKRLTRAKIQAIHNLRQIIV